jgi:ABC-type nitrate/sulfonate/bicarbonate transport system substrate-binding protein
LDALLGGQVDVATAAETPVLLASVQRPDVRIILTIAESELRVVARKSSGISSTKGLRGKRLAVFAGTSSEYFLDRMLEKEGITKSEVEIVNLQPGDMVFAIRNRNVDAISVWEPHAQRAIDILGNDAVSFEDPGLYIEHFNLVTTSEVLDNKEKRLDIVQLVRAVTGASDYMHEQPTTSSSIIASKLGMASMELGAMWNRFTFPAHLDLPTLYSSFDTIEQWSASKQKRNPRDPASLRGLVDPDIFMESQKDTSLLSP